MSLKPMRFKIVVASIICALSLSSCVTDQSSSAGKEKSYNSLSGRSGINGPTLVVKIDDTSSARPQIGLEDADVVYIEQVEGGLTRLAAIFSSVIPQNIGPVRSARISDIDILSQYGKVVFAYSGAQAALLSVIANSNLWDYGAQRQSPTIYTRDPNRSAPYDMVLRADLLLEKAKRDQREISNSKSVGWSFGDAPAGGVAIDSVSLRWPASKYEATWSKTEKRWLLSNGGVANFAAGGKQLGPTTLVRLSNKLKTRSICMSQNVGTARVKRGMAEMLKGGVIMDVVNVEQAKIAEDSGAVAVMALERVPADIRAQGGVARMSDPDMIEKIKAAVSIPVMAKARIGHFVEAQILQSLGVDYIDESEVLTPSDMENHIDKWNFTVPFVCGATNLGEALRRINEGAAMIRSKGEAGTGDVSNAMTHMRSIGGEIRRLSSLREDELYVAAKNMQAPYDLVKEVAETGKLPVVLFTAGGIATPADAALMMQMGADGVFIGSGIFKSGDPALRAAACVKATTFHDDPKVLADVSRGLGEAMVGINVADLPVAHRLAERGW
ncbi:MAG: pyridoxal 5'-phosphate synthase lyase subunit PdxS [Actinobacteria bacterium]|nr:pyridoxal 5'-phosphate synthase lyase subunit PdxS [Actinomycetota bacterium]